MKTKSYSLEQFEIHHLRLQTQIVCPPQQRTMTMDGNNAHPISLDLATSVPSITFTHENQESSTTTPLERNNAHPISLGPVNSVPSSTLTHETHRSDHALTQDMEPYSNFDITDEDDLDNIFAGSDNAEAFF